MKFAEAWQKGEHAEQHGRAITFHNDFKFLLEFRSILTARCLNYVMNVAPPNANSVLDIGCAAGDYYSYLVCQHGSNKIDYEGVDISRVAIEAANNYFKSDRLKVIQGNADLETKTADIVLSVNVVPHQVAAIDHLIQILKCAKQFLILSLRTRDNGETVLDPERSRQRVFGEWVPFIVINAKEMYRTILSSVPEPVRIYSFKKYQMFAGVGTRVLPMSYPWKKRERRLPR